MNTEKIRKTLHSIRSKEFPRCENISTLHELLTNHHKIAEKYSTFRGQCFYKGLIDIGSSAAIVFVIDQIAKKIKEEEEITLLVDGTFNVCPLYASQLLIMSSKVGENVSA